jgi:hypothetical protein
MDAFEFLRVHGPKESERVAVRAGTTYAYFRQIAYGHRFPSRGLALALEHASDGRMTLYHLMHGNSWIEQRRLNWKRGDPYLIVIPQRIKV